jgi:excinuclease ABC subunit A
MNDEIIIKGAKENNLKNIDLTLPKNKLIVFTGVSGSGKSTLAFDTIFAEGQRRYMASLSSYTRQFLGEMKKPDVESIVGLSPAISIDQKTTSDNPRSTVGTVTEIYDYLRLLYARIGTPHCPICHREVMQQSIDQIVDIVLNLPKDSKIMIEAPVVRGEKGTQQKLFASLQKSGYVRVKVDGNIYTFDEQINLDKNVKHNVNVIIDRLIIKDDIRKRLFDSIETATNLSNGLVIVDDFKTEVLHSTKYSCPYCNVSLPDIEPRLFSFNNPFGACDKCLGLGFTQEVDEKLVLKHQDKSINDGGLSLCGWNIDLNSMGSLYYNGLAKKYNFSLDVPVKDLPKNIIDILLYGSKGEEIEVHYKNAKFSGDYTSAWEGIIPNMERRFRESTSEYAKSEIMKYMSILPCDKCHGKRLNDNALSVTINDKNIIDLTDMCVADIKSFLDKLVLSPNQSIIAKDILKEINSRLDFLHNVGLDYLTLSRNAGTLSGGESQRIRLATQIGSGLSGVLYILDEPSIGLHQRDNQKLLSSLKSLRDLGNTLIVVEHDEETMLACDYLVDIGPYAGVHGGKIVAAGTPKEVMMCKDSITANYLTGERKIEVPKTRRKIDKTKMLTIIGAKEHNLKNINVSIPCGLFTCITGVSGSGKSSLINGVIYPALSNKINGSNLPEGKYKEIKGFENFDKVIQIDQSPIGRTPRSNPATYTGVFTDIRDLFAKTPDAKEKGYNSARFSFNVKGGRCEKCSGDGVKKIEMYFLPDVYVPCEVCKGKKFNSETLEVKYKDKNIYDVLEMTVEEALKFFDNIPRIKNKIQTLYDVGLGYIKLGQSATTLSGGEAQRVKLATELSRRSTGKTIYFLDEPTTGLHIYDVEKLNNILQKLVSNGNTVVVIEHNLELIKTCDYIIDLGPEGGNAGGKIIAVGSPEQICDVKESYTGQYLKKYLTTY